MVAVDTVVRVEVRTRGANVVDHRVARDARLYLDIPLYGAEELQVFWLHAKSGASLPREQVNEWAERVLSDPILQAYAIDGRAFDFDSQGTAKPSFAIEVRFRPGVTDNVGRSASEALGIMSEFARAERVQAYSGTLTVLYGQVSRAQAEQIASELLGNELIHEIRVISYAELREGMRFQRQSVPEVQLGAAPEPREIDLDVDAKQLARMSQENCWALTANELETIRAYFARPEVRAARAAEGLPANPTDVEIEILAQTWSEHCKHKIFAAEVQYREQFADQTNYYPSFGGLRVDGLFKTAIKGATKAIQRDRKLDWLVSVFTDNAGIVRFDENLDLCIKVETHNSPSALDPYGGSLTGIVGVNRDVLGCGLGARPIANTDVFCFAPPDWPAPGEERELPHGLKHPRRILEGVHLGIEHGGNKSGIPTVNGAISFHRNFAGKPLVFCGTIGALPPALANGRPTSEKGQKPGHRVVMAGGRIGKDGIHGATFSSMELNERAPATAVQIGDPITQKRLADFLLEARDKELFASVTDNGAGGLSSSVGEMAGLTNGATIDVALAPVKYPGLAPYELVVSESQERMTFAVPVAKLDAFLELAQRRGVEATDLGEFRDDGFFRIRMNGRTVGLLQMDFLHDGLPAMKLRAVWEGPVAEEPWAKAEAKPEVRAEDMNSRAFFESALYRILGAWNVRSKEDLVRRYDHEVQAATVVKPFTGPAADGPSDAAVVWLAPHGGSEKTGIGIGCGLSPKVSRYDAYIMAQHSLDEAVRNCVAVGTDPAQIALCDNFCWPDPLPSAKNPDAEHKLAQLVRACRGLYDLARFYGTPFVSGKDSMKNDFIGKTKQNRDVKISVPPTVLVTAMGKVPSVDKTVTTDFKGAGDKIFVLGVNYRELGGAELTELYSFPHGSFLDRPAKINAHKNLELYGLVHAAIRAGILRSCHDVSEGGVLVALTESALGGDFGFEADFEDCAREFRDFGGSMLEFLFNESPGRFVVSVAPERVEEFVKHFSGVTALPFGEVTEEKVVRVLNAGLVVVDVPLTRAKSAWKGGILS